MSLGTPTITPTDMPSGTPTAAITPTVSATFDPAVLYAYSTLSASGQPVAIVYTFTAGEAAIAAVNMAMLLVLLFVVFLLIVRSNAK